MFTYHIRTSPPHRHTLVLFIFELSPCLDLGYLSLPLNPITHLVSSLSDSCLISITSVVHRYLPPMSFHPPTIPCHSQRSSSNTLTLNLLISPCLLIWIKTSSRTNTTQNGASTPLAQHSDSGTTISSIINKTSSRSVPNSPVFPLTPRATLENAMSNSRQTLVKMVEMSQMSSETNLPGKGETRAKSQAKTSVRTNLQRRNYSKRE